MAELRTRDEFDCSPETFWRECLFNPAFNQEFYVVRQKFPEWRVLEQKEEGSTIFRRVQIEPPSVNIPSAIKKVIGDKLGYVEEGTLDLATGKYAFKIITASMPDKMKTHGELWTEALPPGPGGEARCARLAHVHIQVKVMLVGGTIEDRIQQDTKASYEAVATFTREWLNRKKA